MITNIRAINSEGTSYAATIDGVDYPKIPRQHYFWENVQKAIEEGAEVTPFPTKSKEEILEDTITMIDLRTHQIITGGFQWKGKTLSSSDAAQANFLAVEQARQRGEVTYPIPWFTKDDEYMPITTEEMWFDLLNAKDTHIFYTAKQGGHVLKTAAKAMTEEQLLNWSDPR